MSPEIIATVSVGVALAYLIWNGQRDILTELTAQRQEIAALHEESTALCQGVTALCERIAHLGPHEFRRSG